jgi:hypothetical protein
MGDEILRTMKTENRAHFHELWIKAKTPKNMGTFTG